MSLTARRRSSIAAGLLAFSLYFQVPGALAGVCEPLTIQGNKAQCACSKKGWAALDAQLKALPDIVAPQELSGLVHTFLCASGERASASLHRNMPKLIASSTWETGEEKASVSRLGRDEIGPLGGHAWDASVSQENAQVQLSYAPNEACTASASFIHQAGGWLLVAIGDACD